MGIYLQHNKPLLHIEIIRIGICQETIVPSAYEMPDISYETNSVNEHDLLQ